jgi:hypothetical protein
MVTGAIASRVAFGVRERNPDKQRGALLDRDRPISWREP